MGEVLSFGEGESGPERARSMVENIINSLHKDNIVTMEWLFDATLRPDRDDLEITFDKKYMDGELGPMIDALTTTLRQYLMSDPRFSAFYKSLNSLVIDKNKAVLLFFKH